VDRSPTCDRGLEVQARRGARHHGAARALHDVVAHALVDVLGLTKPRYAPSQTGMPAGEARRVAGFYYGF
jgi:hypothetical protein